MAEVQVFLVGQQGIFFKVPWLNSPPISKILKFLSTGKFFFYISFNIPNSCYKKLICNNIINKNMA